MSEALTVAILLVPPIHIRAAGDHETRSCGTVLSTNLDPWRDVADGGDSYFAGAYRACTRQRVHRLTWAVAIAVTTAAAVTVAARSRSTRPGRQPGASWR